MARLSKFARAAHSHTPAHASSCLRLEARRRRARRPRAPALSRASATSGHGALRRAEHQTGSGISRADGQPSKQSTGACSEKHGPSSPRLRKTGRQSLLPPILPPPTFYLLPPTSPRGTRFFAAARRRSRQQAIGASVQTAGSGTAPRKQRHNSAPCDLMFPKAPTSMRRNLSLPLMHRLRWAIVDADASRLLCRSCVIGSSIA